MACLLVNEHNFEITVPSYENKDGVTFYEIHIIVGSISWIVLRRYKEFVELHETLVMDHCLIKELLPQKKIIGNRNPEFIEKRKISLERYLQTVISFLQRAMPMSLLKFLDVDKYDIPHVLESMALSFTQQERNLVLKTSEYTFNPFQLNAVSERLRECCLTTETYNNGFDFSDILETCNKFETVIIRGSRSSIGTSNLIYNNLTFELTIFKSVARLYLYNVQLSNIYDLGSLRQTVDSLVAYNSNIEKFSDALLCDKIHKTHNDCKEHIWYRLNSIDFSWNELKRIDRSILLAPDLQSLTLDGNHIKIIENTEFLPNLTHLCICANVISIYECLAPKLKHVSHLNLSQNKITTLFPFAKLTTLKELILASNWISDSAEIKHISKLPDLEYLILTGNPVSTIIDYRIKVFEYFDIRARYLCLDNERPSEKELDTAAVLRALSVVREGKSYFHIDDV